MESFFLSKQNVNMLYSLIENNIKSNYGYNCQNYMEHKEKLFNTDSSVGVYLQYPIYDGIRLFLWTIPYLCIIPALAIYYLIENIKNTKPKMPKMYKEHTPILYKFII